MVKKLMMILAIVLVAGLTVAAYAEVQNVKVGGDITIMGLSRYRFNLSEGNGTTIGSGHGDIWAEFARVKIDADLTDNVSTTIRFLQERMWGNLDSITDDSLTTSAQDTNVDLDLAYVTMKEFLYEPLTLVLGRQNIKIGDGLLVADPYTNRTGPTGNKFPSGFTGISMERGFDAMVAVLDYDMLKVTGGYVMGVEGSVFSATDDIDVYALNFLIKEKLLNITPEFTYVLADANKGDVNNYSVRLAAAPLDGLKLRSEFVYQTQRNMRADNKLMSDTAWTFGADFKIPKVKFSPVIGMDYMRLSETWNPMFEGIVTGDIMNGLFINTNMQVIGINASAKPADDWTLKFRYANARFVGDPPTALGVWGGQGITANYAFNSDKSCAGNEYDMHFIYDYTEDVQFALKLAYFDPGNAFTDINDKGATQVCGTMKVTF